MAESLTGGKITSDLVDVPGASDVLYEGCTTYSNGAKQARLLVKHDTLSRCGAVSSETAYQMCTGLLKTSGCDVVLSTTGIAGPGGGSAAKPVGLTYIAGGDGKYTFKMGECSSLAAGVKVWLSSNDYVNELVTHSVPEVKEIQGNVTLGKYTGVGTNSVIMPNKDIPEGVSIGALSFVPSNYKFEPWTVYAGRPIRPIKKRNKENVLNTLRKIGYVK